jgi:hypothetical protein
MKRKRARHPPTKSKEKTTKSREIERSSHSNTCVMCKKKCALFTTTNKKKQGNILISILFDFISILAIRNK